MSEPVWINEVSKLLPAFTGVVGVSFGAVTLIKSLLWKRAELASGYLKELNNTSELVFACRCLDWEAGTLVVPDSLVPLLGDGKKTIEHEKRLVHKAMQVHLTIAETKEDPRLLIYRMCLDALLSWMNVLANSIRKGLFTADDLREVGFWVKSVNTDRYLQPFIGAFRYTDSLTYLADKFGVSPPSDTRHETSDELSVVKRLLTPTDPAERTSIHGIDSREIR